MSVHNTVASFMEAMAAAGVVPSQPIAAHLASGDLIRFSTQDKPRKRNGWAILHLDGRAAGAFGAYHLGVRQTWRSGEVVGLSPAERRDMRQRVQEAAQRREREAMERWGKAAARANEEWDSAAPASRDHPYLVRKGIEPEGMRRRGHLLLVPMRDIQGALWNLQRIAPDGEKRFAAGARTSGLFWIVGEGGTTLCIGEGVGTMAAVRKATGHPVAAAFSGDNLERVARAIHSRWPGLDLIICADDDAHLVTHPQIKKNLGLEYAKAACAAVGGRLAVPPRREV